MEMDGLMCQLVECETHINVLTEKMADVNMMCANPKIDPDHRERAASQVERSKVILRALEAERNELMALIARTQQ